MTIASVCASELGKKKDTVVTVYFRKLFNRFNIISEWIKGEQFSGMVMVWIRTFSIYTISRCLTQGGSSGIPSSQCAQWARSLKSYKCAKEHDLVRKIWILIPGVWVLKTFFGCWHIGSTHQGRRDPIWCVVGLTPCSGCLIANVSIATSLFCPMTKMLFRGNIFKFLVSQKS